MTWKFSIRTATGGTISIVTDDAAGEHGTRALLAAVRERDLCPMVVGAEEVEG